MSYEPFKENRKCHCGKVAELLHVSHGENIFLCWDCSGFKPKTIDDKSDYWKSRANHYASEAKYMALSVRMAWAQLQVANARLLKHNLKAVFNEMETP